LKIQKDKNTLIFNALWGFSLRLHNARLRGWQRITTNSTTTAVTTAAHWDWKRHALTVPLEAFVSYLLLCDSH
ncbi:hypothetical protein, partial [Vibrio cincinnatiensis]|uniref:hypothetical protein n=1 Tax=Vibrio cincinnatiensis TaxID=675 RepID=UPI001FAA1FF9